MEKRESIPAVVENDEDLLIDLGAASVETKGMDVSPIEDEGLPTSSELTE